MPAQRAGLCVTDGLLGHQPYVLARTAETLPPNLGIPGTWPFAALLIAAAALGVTFRRTIAPAHAAALLGFGALSLAIARNIPLFCLVTAPILTQWLRRALESLAPFTRFEMGLSRIESGLRGSFWPTRFPANHVDLALPASDQIGLCTAITLHPSPSGRLTD
jgi:hypothetical protein